MPVSRGLFVYRVDSVGFEDVCTYPWKGIAFIPSNSNNSRLTIKNSRSYDYSRGNGNNVHVVCRVCSWPWCICIRSGRLCGHLCEWFYKIFHPYIIQRKLDHVDPSVVNSSDAGAFLADIMINSLHILKFITYLICPI